MAKMMTTNFTFFTIVLSFAILSTCSGNRPLFSDDAWIQVLFLPHDTKPGSAVYRIQATDNEPVPDYPLTFSVSGPGKEIIDVVSISETEADLVLKQPLQKGQIYKLTLEVRDTANERNIIEIRVNATEASASPQLALLTYPQEPLLVLESTRPGTILTTVTVKKRPDPSDRYPDLILSPTKTFRLYVTLTSTEAQGRLVLEEPLDFEDRNYYTLNITVYRGPNNKLLDNRNLLVLPITIIVVDVQDTNPIFTKLPLVTHMRSDVQEGANVVEIEAIDGDSSNNRPIRYSLLGPNRDSFRIDSKSGIISTAKPAHQILPGCQDAAILLQVKAEEESDSRASTTQEIVIFIEANKQSIPKFSAKEYRTNIDENAAILTPLVFPEPIRILDEGSCTLLRVAIQDTGQSRGSEIFGMNPTLIVRAAFIDLFVKNPALLDYELQQEITFQIIAYPNRTSPDSQASTATINVIINDVNDHAPIFLRDEYVAKISESAGEGAFIAHVTASDPDRGKFGTIRYTRILGDSFLPPNLLNLDHDTGIITLAQSSQLDREQTDRYEVQVEACDEDGHGLCNTTNLLIHIMDENDNVPTFSRRNYYTCLTKSMRRGEIIFNLKAIDKDEPDTANTKVRYEITGGSFNSYFHINSRGNVSLTEDVSKMNGIDSASATIVVKASDGGIPQQSSQTTLHISLDPLQCRGRSVEYIVSSSDREVQRNKEKMERLLSELNGGTITRIDAVKPIDDKNSLESKSRIITSVVQHENQSVVDLTVWERYLKNPDTEIVPRPIENSPSEAPVSEAWKWVLIALLILLAIVLLILLCCCLCRPHSKNQQAPSRSRHRQHRHHQRLQERIRSAPMANGKANSNFAYSRHVQEDGGTGVDSAKSNNKQRNVIVRNVESANNQLQLQPQPQREESSVVTTRSGNHVAEPPQPLMLLPLSEAAAAAGVVNSEEERIRQEVEENADYSTGPRAQLKNQFLEKKSLFTIAYDGMHSRHNLLKDNDFPSSANPPIS